MSRKPRSSTDRPEAPDYYVRQVAFAGIGLKGQQRLAASSVALVGCGGTGSVVAEQLTRAGVGQIRIIDRDFVERDNLQRQVLFDEEDARHSLPKAIAAARKLQRVNAQVELDAVVTDVHAENVEALISGMDLVVDGTDNFETRFLLNDVCVKAGTPWIYCAAVSSHGMTMTIVPRRTPCLKCLLPEMPGAGSLPTCATAGVINAITGLIASVASAEAVKLLVGSGQPNGGLISVDLWENTFRSLRVRRRDDCPTCVHECFSHLEARDGTITAHLCGREAVQLRFRRDQAVDLPQLARRLLELGEVYQNEFLVRFRAEDREIVLFPDGRAIIRGVESPTEARRFYAKYVGL